MIIQGASISVTYKRINSIKKVYYTNENILKDYFNEATVLPVPDEAPVEIPRIITKTLHEHAQLSISPTVATFDVEFDGGFEKEWSECERYIMARMEKVFEFLNLLTENCYEYIGIVANVIYDDKVNNGTEKISSTLVNAKKIKGIHDINIKFTFVEKDNIFVNIMLQNARIFKPGLRMDEAGSLSEKNQISEPIGAVIDINDRYGFNNNASYKSNSSVLGELIASMDHIINNKLSSLIEKGEY